MVLCLNVWLLSAQDTTALVLDTLVVDTLGQDTTLRLSLGVPISKDSLDAAVVYNADGYIKFDVSDEKIHLYENAFVSYTTITLRAAHIELDWANSMVLAEGMINDSTGLMDGLPEFADGDNTFTADKIRYNFETRKGIVYDAVSTQDDIQIHGSKSKFISGDPADSTAHDIIYSQDATFTTCTADHPHFAIRSKKQKIIPGKRVIVGPSNLEIMDVPTPLWLPFGFFPISDGRSTGLIFPKDYEYSEQFGFGLKKMGWYFPLGDNVNLTLTGDYYLQGSYGLGANVQYRKRYGYNGSFDFNFDSRNLEGVVLKLDSNGDTLYQDNGQFQQTSVFSRSNGISINWTHNQDASAHPMNKIGGSIRFQTNDFARRVNNDAQSVNTNIINSNFTFSRNWQDKPISMSLAFRHSQNTQTRKMQVDFPTFNFQTQTLYPLRRKERVGAKKWYEDITLRYTHESRANFSAPDTSFFEQSTLDDARYGMKHDVSTGTSIKLLKYFNLNPSVSYKEVWYGERIDTRFDDANGVVLDTIALVNDNIRDTIDYGTYVVDTIPKFSSYRTYSASVGLNTQIFGTLRFKNGPLRGVRHVIKPTLSMGYQPNYRGNENYYNYLQDTLELNDKEYFSKFQNGIYGAPPKTGSQMALNYSITNILEAKIFSRKDSTEKNIKLFDNIYINGSYNFAADTAKWSPIRVTGTTRFFKGASTFNFTANFDPLVRVQRGETTSFDRIDVTTWSVNKKPFEFVDATFRFTTNLTVAKIRALFQGKEEELVEAVDERGSNLLAVEETDFLSLFENFSIRHNLSFGLTPLTVEKDTFRTTTHSIELRGSLGLTPNWQVDIGSIGYDFVRKQTTYPYLGLSRDLHCWEMGFNWAPTRNTYSFYLRVKPGTLDFLKVPYKRNNVDGSDPF